MGPYYDTAIISRLVRNPETTLFTDLGDPRLPDHLQQEDRLTFPVLIFLVTLMVGGLALAGGGMPETPEPVALAAPETLLPDGG